MMTSPVNLWSELNNSKWKPIPSLGLKWIGKWTFSDSGYTIIIHDGAYFWGERRKSSYVKEKAEEWAACLESGVKELSDLVLSQLEESDAEIQISNVGENLNIDLSACLDQLPYNWRFDLTRLTSDIIEHHWTTLVATSLEFMSQRISKLEDELIRKNSQLEELLPQQPKPNKSREEILDRCLEQAIQNVNAKGIGNILSNNLCTSLSENKLLKESKNGVSKKCENLKPSSVPHNKPRLKTRKCTRTS
ncbi:hypothetical protein Avbf_15761 [Armadillidium vulgare]|nr:hypothetical protein Avbf_15761 [Armadillidium vulgare]